jgi:hypothetical protein
MDTPEAKAARHAASNIRRKLAVQKHHVREALLKGNSDLALKRATKYGFSLEECKLAPVYNAPECVTTGLTPKPEPLPDLPLIDPPPVHKPATGCTVVTVIKRPTNPRFLLVKTPEGIEACLWRTRNYRPGTRVAVRPDQFSGGVQFYIEDRSVQLELPQG